MSTSLQLVASLPLLAPLCAAAYLGLCGSRLKGRTAGGIAVAAAGLAALASLILFVRLMTLPEGAQSLTCTFYSWIGLGSLEIPCGILYDPLSALWSLVVAGVGSLIFLFSVSYMEGDKGYARYFSYLCLFLFSMLILVLGENLVLTFVGWEGVGLCSYLLIGFEYDKEKAADAGRKAFIVNRIGDVGFLIGMFWVFQSFGTLSHEPLAAAIGTNPLPLWMALAFFLGAVGKSAQAPLFVWLPDAMAGPTPVSALIHAATMVTAGVYLLCRLSLLFANAGAALLVVACVGTLTALIAGLIALRQTDIKRVLAYSTISQLGYMFLACGCGAFSAAAFHVTTHAFFKALLFLGSGAVIHAMHGEQNLMKMGGLKKQLPRTYSSMRFGALALAGIAPFAGFFSKDEILGASFAGNHYLLFGAGTLTAALTAFYTSRMMTLCFHGESRVPEGIHPHEPPALQAAPLSILKWLSLFGGLALGVEILHYRPLHWFLNPVFAPAYSVLDPHHLSTATMAVLLTLAFGIAVGAWMLARRLFLSDQTTLAQLELMAPPVAKAIAARFWVDEIYDAAICKPLRRLSQICGRFDLGIVDGIYNGTGTVVAVFSNIVRLAQTGVVHVYGLWFLLGAIVILALTLG